MYQILVRELEFYAFHGVPDAEQEVGHRYLVNLTLTISHPITGVDSFDGLVDYGAVSLAVVDLATTAQYRTVEALAHAICTRLFERFPLIAEVDIELLKRMPPAPVIANSIGIRLILPRPPVNS